MNESIEGVRVLSAFIFDVLREYEPDRTTSAPLFEMTRELDRTRDDEWVPIALYNRVCAWAEAQLGPLRLQRAGRNIGARIYSRMVDAGLLGARPTPLEVMEALSRLSRVVVRDPLGRGWDLLQAREGVIHMRKTQTFNCVLQLGSLPAQLERAGVAYPAVSQVRCTRRGDAFCEYQVRWAPSRATR